MVDPVPARGAPGAAPVGAPADATSLPHVFRPMRLRGVTLRNRIVVSPMCQYSCEAGDGLPTDWHFVHLGSRAVGGAALVFTEAAAVVPEGRISPQDLGMWSDAHADALAPIAAFVRARGAAAGIQLAHAGRKASTTRPWEGTRGLSDAEGGWTPVAPSALAFSETVRAPRVLAPGEIGAVIAAFEQAASRADRVGFDVLEVHAAHGYLIHEFLSPLSNRRTDRYGGDFSRRIRLLIEVVEAIRRVWPESKPLFVRVSATDWVPGGWDVDDTTRLARELAGRGVDVIDCSSGGLSPLQRIALEPGYQVPFAERIRREISVATMAVGLISAADQAERILAEGRADLVALAREFLRDPYFPFHAAKALGGGDDELWPPQYVRAR